MVSACPNDHATPACGVTSSRNFIFADSPDAGLIKASSDAGNLSGGKVCVLDPKKDYYLNVWTNRSDWNSPTQCPRGCFNQVYMMVVPLLSR